MGNKERIVVTGMGLVTPLGSCLSTIWNRLLDGENAACSWKDLEKEDFRHTIACRIQDGPWTQKSSSRGRSLAVAAAQAAVQHAEIDLPSNAAVFIGSTMGESSSFELAAGDGNTDSLLSETSVAFPHAICEALKLHGPSRAYGTACASGNYAIGAAATSLRNHRCDVVLAGGVEPFSRIAMTGFSRTRAMSSHGTCRPFDQKRDGMILGEGAAVMVMEREDDALARGATPLAEVGALGLSCDAYHPTAPHPKGRGGAAAFSSALNLQKLHPHEVGWICAHGSGTSLSDLAEANAMKTTFGNKMPPVSGLKGSLGHSMGAATAIETAICILALQNQILPPTTGLRKPDFDIPVITEKTPASVKWIANSGFAFGGLNSVLLLGAI